MKRTETDSVPIEVLPGTPIPDAVCEDWNRHVAAAKSVHAEQTTFWSEARRADGWSPGLFALRSRDGTIQSGAAIQVRRVGGGLRVGYVSRGPLIFGPDSADSAQRVDTLIRGLKQYARRAGLACLIVDPPYFSEPLCAAMVNGGFMPHLQHLPPTGYARGTLLIDLAPSEEQVLMAMRRSNRSLFRKSPSSGLVWRRGGSADIDLLWSLMVELCRRRGVAPNVSGAELMRQVWNRFSPSASARMDVLEFDGRPLVALMTFCIGSWAIPWRIGWSGEEPRRSPEKILYWHVIQDLKRNGARTFDFNWVDPEEAEAVLSGGDVPESTEKGMTLFKMGFGGTVHRLSPPLDYFPNPAVRLLLRWGGTRFLNSTGFARIKSSLRSLRRR